MAERKLRGTVIDKHTERRYEDATVRLQGEGHAPALANTDDDGDFEFDVTDEKTWPPGKYTLRAFHPDSQQVAEKVPKEKVLKEIELEAGKPPERQQIQMLSNKERHSGAGWAFLGVLVLVLGVLFWQFIDLHQKYPNKSLPLDESLTALVERAQHQATEPLTVTSPVSTTIATAEAVFTSLQNEPNQTLINARKGEMIKTLFAEARTAIEAGDLSGLKTVLRSINELVVQPASYFWQSDPWRLVEILMWALAATIISLAISTGHSLSERNFYWRAIPAHITYLFTTPIVAVVIAFILSLVTISITVSGVELKLDMGNVTISILVAVLIGLARHKALTFVNELANLLFSKLLKAVGAKEEAEKVEEEKEGAKEKAEEKEEKEEAEEEEAAAKPIRQPVLTLKRRAPSETWDLPTWK